MHRQAAQTAIQTHEQTGEQARIRERRWKAAFVAMLLGAIVILVSGFAPMESVHDAAHDSRHGFSFPCH